MGGGGQWLTTRHWLSESADKSEKSICVSQPLCLLSNMVSNRTLTWPYKGFLPLSLLSLKYWGPSACLWCDYIPNTKAKNTAFLGKRNTHRVGPGCMFSSFLSGFSLPMCTYSMYWIFFLIFFSFTTHFKLNENLSSRLEHIILPTLINKILYI